MDKKTLKKFHHVLSNHRELILEWLNEESIPKDVHLGKNTTSDVYQVLTDIKQALDKMDSGEFGKCKVCDGEVETERLELDYTTDICLDHYTKEQIRALEADLELAGRVQRELLPCCFPELPKIDIAIHAESARVVGGDYYDFFVNKDGAQGFVIADVMGKGLPASLLMANLQASLRILGPQYQSPHHILNRLNELFRNNLTLIRFISIFIGIIDTQSQILTFSNAGHHPPILWNNNKGNIQLLEPTGPAIGLTHDGSFQSSTIDLGSKDLILLYTDGLIELRNEEGLEFGEKRLVNFVKTHPKESAVSFIHDLQTTIKKYTKKLHDDLSVIVLRIK